MPNTASARKICVIIGLIFSTRHSFFKSDHENDPKKFDTGLNLKLLYGSLLHIAGSKYNGRFLFVGILRNFKKCVNESKY